MGPQSYFRILGFHTSRAASDLFDAGIKILMHRCQQIYEAQRRAYENGPVHSGHRIKLLMQRCLCENPNCHFISLAGPASPKSCLSPLSVCLSVFLFVSLSLSPSLSLTLHVHSVSLLLLITTQATRAQKPFEKKISQGNHAGSSHG